MIIPFSEEHFADTTDFARKIYNSDYWEDAESFRLKMKLFPAGCLAYKLDKIVGYIFSHPYSDSIVNLSEHISLPISPDIYYIHDLAVDIDYRGRDIGTQLANHVINLAWSIGFNKIKLVSVLHSEKFWVRLGFNPVQEIKYGPGPATVMIRSRDV